MKIQIFIILVFHSVINLSNLDAKELKGPLQLNDLSPFSIGKINFREIEVSHPNNGGFSISYGLSVANNFIVENYTEGFLSERVIPDSAVSEADVTNLIDFPRDVFIFDAEVSQLNFKINYQYADNFTVFFDIDLVSIGGGFLDSSVDRFHKLFGFSDEGRGYFPLNDSSFLLKLDGIEPIWIPNIRQNLTIPSIGFVWNNHTINEWNIDLQLQYQLSGGKKNDFFKSANHPIGIQAAIYKQVENHFFYFSTGSLFLNDKGPISIIKRKQQNSITLSYEHYRSDNQSWILQLNAYKSTLKTSANKELSDNIYLVSVGWRWYLEKGSFDITLTENVIHFDNSSDIALHFRLMQLF